MDVKFMEIYFQTAIPWTLKYMYCSKMSLNEKISIL